MAIIGFCVYTLDIFTVITRTVIYSRHSKVKNRTENFLVSYHTSISKKSY